MTVGDRPKFAAAMLRMQEVYDVPVSEAKAEAYYDALVELDWRDLEPAIREAVKRCKFFPRPAELIEIAHEFHRERLVEQEQQAERERWNALPAGPAPTAEERQAALERWKALGREIESKLTWRDREAYARDQREKDARWRKE